MFKLNNNNRFYTGESVIIHYKVFNIHYYKLIISKQLNYFCVILSIQEFKNMYCSNYI